MTERERRIEHAIALMREARGELLSACALKAWQKAHSAVKSAEGALRHAQNMATRQHIEQHTGPKVTGITLDEE